jgi:hypothetical protein
MNITVTLDASPSLLDAIQLLAKGLHLVGASPSTQEKPTKGKKEHNLNGTEQTASNTVQQNDFTLEIVRNKVKAVSDAGKREQVKSLLADFGTDRVTNLAKDKYPDFIKKLEAL